MNNNTITQIKESWNSGWKDEFNKEWGNKKLKQNFDVVLHESARKFLEKVDKTSKIKNPLTKLINNNIFNPSNFKKQVAEILGVNQDEYLNANILLALGETREKVDMILNGSKLNTKNTIISPTTEELIHIWKNGWDYKVLEYMKENNVLFVEAFYKSVDLLPGNTEELTKLKSFLASFSLQEKTAKFYIKIIKIFGVRRSIENLVQSLYSNDAESYNKYMKNLKKTISEIRNKRIVFSEHVGFRPNNQIGTSNARFFN